MIDSEIIFFLIVCTGMAAALVKLIFLWCTLIKTKINKQIRSKLRHICVRICSGKLSYMSARHQYSTVNMMLLSSFVQLFITHNSFNQDFYDALEVSVCFSLIVALSSLNNIKLHPILCFALLLHYYCTIIRICFSFDF